MKGPAPTTATASREEQARRAASGPAHGGRTSWQHYLTALAHDVTGPTGPGVRGGGGLSRPLRARSWLWPPVADPELVEELLTTLLSHGFSDEQAATTGRSFFVLANGYCLLSTMRFQDCDRGDPVHELPTLARLAPLLSGEESLEQFLVAIETLIDTTERELATTPRAAKTGTPAPAPRRRYERSRKEIVKSSLAIAPATLRMLPCPTPLDTFSRAAVLTQPTQPCPPAATVQDLVHMACGLNDHGVVHLDVDELDELGSWIRVLPDPQIVTRRNHDTGTRCVDISAAHRKPVIQGPITVTWHTDDSSHPLWARLLHGEDLAVGTERELSAHQLLATLDRLRLAQSAPPAQE
ncbi:MAG: hypothetical protein WA962_02750 [Ornithinimicrobium sp.]